MEAKKRDTNWREVLEQRTFCCYCCFAKWEKSAFYCPDRMIQARGNVGRFSTGNHKETRTQRNLGWKKHTSSFAQEEQRRLG